MNKLYYETTYYPSGFIKSVYLEYGLGRKQGHSVTYEDYADTGSMFEHVKYKETFVDDKRMEIVYANGDYKRFDDQGNEIYRLTGTEEISRPLNGQCFKKVRWFEENKSGKKGEWKDRIIEEWEQKDGKKHGLAKKYSPIGDLYLYCETQYKDGKKHGFEKLYNSDGTVVKMKYWQNGKDCTAKYNRLKKIASKHIEKEKAIEAKTGKKTRLPKMSKLEKTVAIAKEKLGLSK